ncbi:hypothetical protein D1164_14825 [Mariniphaga sediminis]|uniref:OmpA-like domain-containing protein n=2 Tax=Mariniphaga sediminis TaxID=1628158 RepID=A0A399D0V4_9BACT|nr:OmpA family protein [Mariniphaga sediminis]RIH64362.1 hypothetical protein D1164_14825 [Mariniphaga sediminis]
MKRKTTTILLLFITLASTVNGQQYNFFDLVDYKVRLLPSVNTVESDISPAFVKGELYFSSIREEYFGNERLQQRNMSFYDVYSTEIDSVGNPVSLRKLVPGFGNLYHEGPVSWCEATGELFVTLSNVIDGDTIHHGMINEEHVRLRLVIMKETDGKWTVTEELPFNRDNYHFAHPAVSVTGDTLIFSSDMRRGYGKSDLYMSVREDGKWSRPQNLGEMINTPGNEMFPTFGPDGLLLFSSDGHEENYGQMDIYYTNFPHHISPVNAGRKLNTAFDDFGLVVHPSKEYGYFSSNRPGRGNDDIYHIEFIPVTETLNGKVSTRYNGEPVSDAIVYLQDCNGNVIETKQSGILGNFEFEIQKGLCYRLMAEKEGFQSDLENLAGRNIVELQLKQILKYQIQVLDFGDGKSLPEADVLCLEEKWETDTSGLVRIQFDSLMVYNVHVIKEGYFDYSKNVDSTYFTMGANVVDTIQLFKKERNKNFLLKNINYYFDRWRIMPESEPELQKLIKLMKDNPSLKVELETHTDSRREDEFNLWLSQKRADSIVEYLVENGIEKERLTAKGYGETRLLNRCANGVNCSEAEHLVNRRVEFKILGF